MCTAQGKKKFREANVFCTNPIGFSALLFFESYTLGDTNYTHNLYYSTTASVACENSPFAIFSRTD